MEKEILVLTSEKNAACFDLIRERAQFVTEIIPSTDPWTAVLIDVRIEKCASLLSDIRSCFPNTPICALLPNRSPSELARLVRLELSDYFCFEDQSAEELCFLIARATSQKALMSHMERMEVLLEDLRSKQSIASRGLKFETQCRARIEELLRLSTDTKIDDLLTWIVNRAPEVSTILRLYPEGVFRSIFSRDAKSLVIPISNAKDISSDLRKHFRFSYPVITDQGYEWVLVSEENSPFVDDVAQVLRWIIASAERRHLRNNDRDEEGFLKITHFQPPAVGTLCLLRITRPAGQSLGDRSKQIQMIRERLGQIAKADLQIVRVDFDTLLTVAPDGTLLDGISIADGILQKFPEMAAVTSLFNGNLSPVLDSCWAEIPEQGLKVIKDLGGLRATTKLPTNRPKLRDL